MLKTTKEAAQAVGLSQYELRLGWKQGRYPALLIGREGERRRLRWDPDALQRAIDREMQRGVR